MAQVELANFPTERCIIDPNVYDLFDGPYGVVHLPSHYGEVDHLGVMTCSVGVS